MVIFKRTLNNKVSAVKAKTAHPQSVAGFTLMEIVVATTIFAIVASAMMSLFNYTLKINRRSEALRQASQGMRDFVEFLVKEIRNGRVDYFVVNGSTAPPIDPCRVATGFNVGEDNTYAEKQNWLAIITPEGQEECFYYGNSLGIKQTDSQVFTDPTGTLVIKKGGSGQTAQILNPPNLTVQSLAFIVSPLKDPYTPDGLGAFAGEQPFVSMFMKFVLKLPTGETVPISYQTSVSTDKYDVPHK